jgi:hypothetical protein
MFSMFRCAAMFLLFLLVIGLPVYAQTPPPGAPFDASKHPNPIITFVESKAFKPVSSHEARKETGIELLGISLEEGKRENLEMAEGRFVKNMSILGFRTDVTYYPVVRQTFKLTEGGNLVLHSFRFPKVSLPRDFAQIVLNEASVEKKKKPTEMRFGGAKPETFDIRGSGALLFENEGEITIYWQEEGLGHTATARLPRRELFQMIEDLL